MGPWDFRPLAAGTLARLRGRPGPGFGAAGTLAPDDMTYAPDVAATAAISLAGTLERSLEER